MTSKAETLRRRHEIFSKIRAFFDSRNFIEVHTPLLVANPGLEPHLIPFETRFEPDMGGGEAIEFYLPTSPEYHLKKALALGLPRVFEITRSFRNGEKSRKHEPEFFMLEWYRAPGELTEIARDFSEMLAGLGERFAPSKPWGKAKFMTVKEAFKTFADVDLDAALDAGKMNHEDFNMVMVSKIEPKLGFDGPLFLFDYPASECALAKIKSEDPRYCERFEVYWQGVELANAFGELLDEKEQRRRCEEDCQARIKLYGKSPPLDEAFLAALSHIPNPAAGIAVGVDRLILCLLGKERLQDVIAFPHWDSL